MRGPSHGTLSEYDALARVTKVTGPTGVITETRYDAASRVTSEFDTAGNRTRTEYDDVGRVTAIIEAEGATIRNRYDAVGRLINLPEDHVIAMFVAIGKGTKEAWPRPGQLPASDVVITDRF